MPRVSVIIATYNRADLLPEAVRSVLDQSMPDFELLVVDDGSTDNTAGVMAPFLADSRVRLIEQSNQGRSAARNAGASLARAVYLGFLDSDDRYTPNALEAHLQVLDEDSELGLTVGGYAYMDAAGRHLGWRRPWTEGGNLDMPGWLFNCFGMPGAVLMRRSWYENAGGFNAAVGIADDWSLFLQLAVRGCPMAWVRSLTCHYRLHAGNSIRRLADHLAGSLTALDLVFAKADLPTSIAELRHPACAWTHVVFARKACAAGEANLASDWLERAVRRDPGLLGTRRGYLLENLLTPPPEWIGSLETYAAAVAAALPAWMRPTPRELRRAIARIAMSGFFREASEGDRQAAARHLRAGLRHDPTWLANRGVLSFLAHQWSRLRPSA